MDGVIAGMHILVSLVVVGLAFGTPLATIRKDIGDKPGVSESSLVTYKLLRTCIKVSAASEKDQIGCLSNLKKNCNPLVDTADILGDQARATLCALMWYTKDGKKTGMDFTGSNPFGDITSDSETKEGSVVMNCLLLVSVIGAFLAGLSAPVAHWQFPTTTVMKTPASHFFYIASAILASAAALIFFVSFKPHATLKMPDAATTSPDGMITENSKVAIGGWALLAGAVLSVLALVLVRTNK